MRNVLVYQFSIISLKQKHFFHKIYKIMHFFTNMMAYFIKNNINAYISRKARRNYDLYGSVPVVSICKCVILPKCKCSLCWLPLICIIYWIVFQIKGKYTYFCDYSCLLLAFHAFLGAHEHQTVCVKSMYIQINCEKWTFLTYM